MNIPPTVPTIHLGGTGVDDLIKGYVNAAHIIDAAYQAVIQTGPHGRDYPGGGLTDAVREHRDRLVRLREVRDELHMITEALANVRDARDRSNAAYIARSETQ